MKSFGDVQALSSPVRTARLEVQAARQGQIVDITDDVARKVAASGVVAGIAWVFCQHTTCGIWINEFEDGLMEDLSKRLPSLVDNDYYAHDDLARRTQNVQGPDELPNGPAHLRQMLFGATSQMVPIIDGELALGRWQRLLFVEFDAPRPRALLVTVLSASFSSGNI